MTTTQTTSPIQGPNVTGNASAAEVKAKEDQLKQMAEQQKAAEEAKAKKDAEDAAAAEALAQKEAESKKRTIYSPTSAPDGAPTPGKLVKATDMVRPTVPNCEVLVDSLTMVQYRKGVWTEAVPSAFLDGQLRAKKIEVR